MLCKFCHEYVTEDRHQCYQRCIWTGALSTECKLMFFDCEKTSQDADMHFTAGFSPGDDGICTNCRKVTCGQNTNVPVTIVSETACNQCVKYSNLKTHPRCPNCGPRCKMCGKKGWSIRETPLQKHLWKTPHGVLWRKQRHTVPSIHRYWTPQGLYSHKSQWK